MSSEQEQKEQNVVEEHKKMVIMTGNLSDFQLKNLKTWPFLVFDGLESVEVSYDFTKLIDDAETLTPGKVEFNFTFKKGTKMDRSQTKERLEQLSVWTKFLFWKDTEVLFKESGKAWEV